MTSKIAAALVKAQKSRSPEGRMAEAKLLRSMIASGKSLRSKDGTPPIDRLMSKVTFGASDCWYWIGHIDALGYGRFLALGENKAHRVAYRLFHGAIPDGHSVMHSCDTRCCVNPSHLSVGTQAENVSDMYKKGRNRSVSLYGSKNPMAKATDSVVAAIRHEVSEGAKQCDMAEKYGLSRMTVSRIVRMESWK